MATQDAHEALIRALYDNFTSPNVSDSNGEAANIVDTTNRIASALFAIAKAVDNVAEALRERTHE